MIAAQAMLAALILDVAVGWPRMLFNRVRHPVVWIGALIDRADARWNRPELSDSRRRLLGVAAALGVVATAATPTIVLDLLLPAGLAAALAIGVLAWPLLAARSLHDHVAAVAKPLAAGDLAEARIEVSKIVGRDPARLDEAGVGRATLESLAENASDGVTAPIFWGLVFGLPGIAGYKALNTLDSMIGHRTEKHRAFGWASARLDDVANWLPARLTAALFALVSGRTSAALTVAFLDARHHRSPNAGWPEAAMAGALDVRLSGPRSYGDAVSDEPWLNDGAADPTPEDVRRGLALYRRAMGLLAAVLLLLAVL